MAEVVELVVGVGCGESVEGVFGDHDGDVYCEFYRELVCEFVSAVAAVGGDESAEAEAGAGGGVLYRDWYVGGRWSAVLAGVGYVASS